MNPPPPFVPFPILVPVPVLLLEIISKTPRNKNKDFEFRRIFDKYDIQLIEVRDGSTIFQAMIRLDVIQNLKPLQEELLRVSNLESTELRLCGEPVELTRLVQTVMQMRPKVQSLPPTQTTPPPLLEHVEPKRPPTLSELALVAATQRKAYHETLLKNDGKWPYEPPLEDDSENVLSV